jgi:hypothetical protein
MSAIKSTLSRISLNFSSDSMAGDSLVGVETPRLTVKAQACRPTTRALEGGLVATGVEASEKSSAGAK